MELNKLADKVLRRTLTKRELTAGEIAARVGGGYTGRGIAKAIGVLVDCGEITNHGGRTPRYTKAA